LYANVRQREVTMICRKKAVLALRIVAVTMTIWCAPVQAQEPAPSRHVAVAAESEAGKALVGRLREGGLVLYFRHADTRGMACDRTYRVGEREGQRNISAAGREQSRRIGRALEALDIPIARPVLAGPVFRARDTAELAFGAAQVQIVDGLLADDYAGGRLSWVLGEHRRLFSEPMGLGANRVLVGHRTPAIMVLGQTIGGTAFPEGAALVIEPAASGPNVLGILEVASLPGGGFHNC